MNRESYIDDERDDDRIRNEEEARELNREHARELEQPGGGEETDEG